MSPDDPKPLLPTSAEQADAQASERRAYLKGLREAWAIVRFESERYYTCGGLARAALRGIDKKISESTPERPTG